MDQRSPEWRAARLGLPTASNFDKIVTKSGSPSDQAQSYMCRLICERVFARSMEEPVDNKWIRHGIEYEDEAAREFEAMSNERVERCGFILSGDGNYGASPDRLIVGKSRCVEIKCPSPWKHVDYLLHGPGKDYKPQIQGQMLVGGYEAAYFFSYFPGMPACFKFVERDDNFINTLQTALYVFCKNLDKQTKVMTDHYNDGFLDYDLALETISKLMPEFC